MQPGSEDDDTIATISATTRKIDLQYGEMPLRGAPSAIRLGAATPSPPSTRSARKRFYPSGRWGYRLQPVHRQPLPPENKLPMIADTHTSMTAMERNARRPQLAVQTANGS